MSQSEQLLFDRRRVGEVTPPLKVNNKDGPILGNFVLEEIFILFFRLQLSTLSRNLFDPLHVGGAGGGAQEILSC